MKQIIFSLLTLSLWITACNNEKKKDDGDKKDGMMENAMSNTERNKQNVLKSLEAFNTGDFKTFAMYASTNMVDHDPGVNGMVRNGIDSVLANLKAFLTAFPDMKITPMHTVAEGDWVAVFSNWTGTWKGDMMGMKPTGKAFNVNDADLFKMDSEGKVLEHWATQEFGSLMQQIGMPMGK
jgi:predicted ester cyclase